MANRHRKPDTKVPGYALPTHASATRESITSEHKRQQRESSHPLQQCEVRLSYDKPSAKHPQPGRGQSTFGFKVEIVSTGQTSKHTNSRDYLHVDLPINTRGAPKRIVAKSASNHARDDTRYKPRNKHSDHPRPVSGSLGRQNKRQNNDRYLEGNVVEYSYREMSEQTPPMTVARSPVSKDFIERSVEYKLPNNLPKSHRDVNISHKSQMNERGTSLDTNDNELFHNKRVTDRANREDKIQPALVFGEYGESLDIYRDENVRDSKNSNREYHGDFEEAGKRITPGEDCSEISQFPHQMLEEPKPIAAHPYKNCQPERDESTADINSGAEKNSPQSGEQEAPGQWIPESTNSGQAIAVNNREPAEQKKWNGARPKQKPTKIKPENEGKDKPYEKFDHRQREWTRNEDIASQSLNLKFYKNEMKSKPWGIKIEEMLKWRGDYRKLESNHSYIQWLFPTQEYSRVNSYAQPIQFHEAEEIRDTQELQDRFLRAYKMMLDFYGMELKSKDTGEVQRCQKNYKDRFRHLNRSAHNFYRITRILIALGIFGFGKFQGPWLVFMMREKFVHKTLPDIPFGVLHHWIGAVNSDEDRTDVMVTFTTLSENTDSARPARNLPKAAARSSHDSPGRSDKVKLKDYLPNAQRDDSMNRAIEMTDIGVATDGDDNEKLHKLHKPVQDDRGNSGGDQVELGAAAEDSDSDDGDNHKPTFSEHEDRKEINETPEVVNDGGEKNEPKEQDKKCDHQQQECSREDNEPSLNLKFYNNEVAFEPYGCKIEEMLGWKGDYVTLESNHFYIPWLFPTGEGSKTNSYAQPIQFSEAEKIRETQELKDRFLEAYKMMLDFYGMELKSEETGEVQRCQKNYKERFEHLDRSAHNRLRITRILTALGIFGFEHFQVPWLLFMIHEILEHKTLSGIPGDVLDHWIGALNNDEDRAEAMLEFSRLTDNLK